MKQLGVGRWLVLTGALGLIAAACSSGGGGNSGSGGSSGGGGSSGQDFSTQFCELLRPCCADAGFGTGLNGCKFMVNQEPTDKVAAEECLTEFKARAAEPNWCTVGIAKGRPEVCDRAFPEPWGETETPTGTQPVGGSCERREDCAADPRGPVWCMEYSSVDIDPHCRVYSRQGAGQACQGDLLPGGEVWASAEPGTLEVPVCDQGAGLYCVGGVCGAIPTIGQPCYLDCAEGAYCHVDVCVERSGVGSSCAERACVESAYCDGETDTCSPMKANGEACYEDGQCVSEHCASGQCGDEEAPVGFLEFLCF